MKIWGKYNDENNVNFAKGGYGEYKEKMTRFLTLPFCYLYSI